MQAKRCRCNSKSAHRSLPLNCRPASMLATFSRYFTAGFCRYLTQATTKASLERPKPHSHLFGKSDAPAECRQAASAGSEPAHTPVAWPATQQVDERTGALVGSLQMLAVHAWLAGWLLVDAGYEICVRADKACAGRRCGGMRKMRRLSADSSPDALAALHLYKCRCSP